MTRHSLIAVVAGAPPADLAADLTSVTDAGLVTILGPASLRPPLTRRAAAKEAQARMACLETLIDAGPLVPALPAITLTKDEARIALRANAALLNDVTHRFAETVQYQVQISWDPAVALAEKRRGALDLAGDDAASLAASFARAATERFETCCVDQIALPLVPGLVVNSAVLVARARQPELDEALQDLDAIWSDGLKIRQIGPSPVVSFCSLGLRRLRPRETRGARMQLGLPLNFTQDALRAARHAALKSAAPDRTEILFRAAEICGRALEGGTGDGPTLECVPWSEGKAVMPGADATRWKGAA